jgi:GT2 family glycosyltransferase
LEFSLFAQNNGGAMKNFYSIVIPTWNGRRLLEKNLDSVLVTGADEVVVVENGSSDGSLEYLQERRKRFKSLKVVSLAKNLGFGRGCNLGVEKTRGEIVVLLNNDVVPEGNFLEPLKKDFADPQVFAVSCCEPQWSWAKVEWRDGFLRHSVGQKTAKTHDSFWASGGSAAFRKSIWAELGGFDPLYAPFYWEDVDLCYRARKRGYKILWEPKSVVYHQHEGTIGVKFSKSYVDLIKQRNELLFIWKNITNKKRFAEHKQALWRRMVEHPGYIKVVLAALKKFSEVRVKREKEKELDETFGNRCQL